jgi:hypothetical protein
MRDNLGKTPEILFEPKINSLKFKEIASGCYKPTPLTQHYIQNVHMKLTDFTTQLQSSTHITHCSHTNQKSLRLNLDRALGGQSIWIGYLLKITTEPIGNNRGLADGKVHQFLDDR